MAVYLLSKGGESTAKARRYSRTLERLLAEVGSTEQEHIVNVLAMLEMARRRITETLAEIPSDTFQAHHAQLVRADIVEQMRMFAARAQTEVTAGLNQTALLAAEGTVETLRVVGRIVPGTLGGSAVPQLVEIVQGFTAQLITGLSDEAIQAISTQINLGVLAGDRPEAVIERIGRRLDDQAVFRSIAHRAETIFRTEMGRIHSLTTQATMTEAREYAPDIQKTWISALHPGRTRPAHWAAHGQIRAVDDPFVVGGESLMYPRDPSGSAGNVINCLCANAPYVPELDEEWPELAKEQREAAGAA